MNKDNTKKLFSHIKYCYFDLDGTLLNSNKELSSTLVKEIKKLETEGMKFGLATGRCFLMTQHVQETLKPDLPTICVNGAVIHFPNKNEVLDYIPHDQALKIISEIEKLKLDYFIYTDADNGLYTNNLENPRIKQLQKAAASQNLKIWDYHLVSLKKLETEKVLKFLIISNEHEANLTKWTLENFDNLTALSSEKNLLDIFAKKCDKLYAIQLVMKELNIKDDEIIFFGDNKNDYLALKNLTHTVCVGTHAPESAEVAKYNTTSADEDGVYEFLKKHFGK